MSKRKYTIRRDEGLHLTDRQREILGNAWNQYVNRLVPVSMREFARLHDFICKGDGDGCRRDRA